MGLIRCLNHPEDNTARSRAKQAAAPSLCGRGGGLVRLPAAAVDAVRRDFRCDQGLRPAQDPPGEAVAVAIRLCILPGHKR